MKQLQKRQATPGNKMHTHWELCELNHHVAQRFFFWTFPQHHEKRISVTFSLNSGWSSLVGMPIFLMDNRTTVLRVSNYKSKYIINQHYWSRDFMFPWIKPFWTHLHSLFVNQILEKKCTWKMPNLKTAKNSSQTLTMAALPAIMGSEWWICSAKWCCFWG